MKKLTNGQISTLKKISAAIIATFVEFSTQTKMPTGGQVPESLPLGQAKEAVKVAPDGGHCHIDCKYTYYNESEMGEAIQEKVQEKTESEG